jgi:uncharacterized small protein (DUF1192 family)
MEEDDRPRPRGDAASRLQGELLDSYSRDELAQRIAQLEDEIARARAHRDKATAHMAAAEALFGSKQP